MLAPVPIEEPAICQSKLSLESPSESVIAAEQLK